MRCFLDLDGVLVDFTKGALKAHNIDPKFPITTFNFWRELRLTEGQFWTPLGSAEFWANLEWTPDGKEILDLVERKFGPHNICLLSSPSWSPGSASGKMIWIQKHLRDYSRQFLIGPCKDMLAGPEKLLIDDSQSNIQKWGCAGGLTILVPRPWNTLRKTETISHVRYCLDAFFS